MKTWVTRNGEEIPYNQLSIDHIWNIIKYAKTYGFYTTIISRSIVDNSEDVVITYNCSHEVIHDMYEELNRRNSNL